MPTIICENCGKSFEATRRQVRVGKKTCSQECRWALIGKKNSGELITINCERCGKPFGVIPSHLHLRRYCSRECQHPPVYGVCQNCGITFRHPPSDHAKYCCKQCAETSTQMSEIRSLKTKQAWQDEQKRQRLMTGIHHRSESPAWRNAPHFRSGEQHPRFKGNRKARIASYEHKAWVKAVLKRDGYTCQKCGSQKFLQVHHIKAWADYPEFRFDVENGITLCEECHIDIHGKQHTPKTRKCAHCGKSFRPTKKLSKYCCRQCFFDSR